LVSTPLLDVIGDRECPFVFCAIAESNSTKFAVLANAALAADDRKTRFINDFLFPVKPPIAIRELLGDGVEGSWYATKHVNTARRVLLLLDDRSLAVPPSAKSIGSPH
jgi:hypothetical protein